MYGSFLASLLGGTLAATVKKNAQNATASQQPCQTNNMPIMGPNLASQIAASLWAQSGLGSGYLIGQAQANINPNQIGTIAWNTFASYRPAAPKSDPDILALELRNLEMRTELLEKNSRLRYELKEYARYAEELAGLLEYEKRLTKIRNRDVVQLRRQRRFLYRFYRNILCGMRKAFTYITGYATSS